jgi:hypothetical protein
MEEALQILMGQIDDIKDKISNIEYLNISNQIQSLYKLKSNEHKITFYVSNETVSDDDDDDDDDNNESEIKSEGELEEEDESEIKSDDSDDDVSELSESEYENMTEEQIIERSKMLREKVKLMDSELERLHEIKDSLLQSDLEVKCECTNIFTCFVCPKTCKNYDIICKLCPLFKNMIEHASETKYSLPIKITYVENDENKDVANTLRYLFNYYKNIDLLSDRFIGLIGCISVILNNYISVIDANSRFLEITLSKIDQILDHYQKHQSETNKNLIQYFETTPEETMKIIFTWKNLIQEKLSLLELLNIEY